MSFNKNFELSEALKFGDMADIGNGYSVELEPADSDLVWDDEDDNEANAVHQTVMTVRDKNYSNVIEVMNTPPYRCTGGNEEIGEQNRVAQQESIRSIIERMPKFLDNEATYLETKISSLQAKLDRINEAKEIAKDNDVREPEM